MSTVKLTVAGEWFRAAQVSLFKPTRGMLRCGAVQHPQTLKWQSWARLYASDLTCLSVHASREAAEQAILGFVQELHTGNLVNPQAKAVFIHNFELQGQGQPAQLEPRQVDYIQQWIKRQLKEAAPFYIYAFAGKGKGSKTYRWRQIAGPFKSREEAQNQLQVFLRLPHNPSTPSSEPDQKTSVTIPPAGVAAYIVEPVCEKFLNLSKKDPAVKNYSG